MKCPLNDSLLSTVQESGKHSQKIAFHKIFWQKEVKTGDKTLAFTV